MQESIFPEIKIVEPLKRVGAFIARSLRYLPDTPLSRGDHTFPANHGAEAMFIEELYGDAPATDLKDVA